MGIGRGNGWPGPQEQYSFWGTNPTCIRDIEIPGMADSNAQLARPRTYVNNSPVLIEECALSPVEGQFEDILSKEGKLPYLWTSSTGLLDLCHFAGIGLLHL